MKLRRIKRKLRKNKSLATLTGTFFLGAAVVMVAHAEERETQFTSRAYVGGGVGASQLNPKTSHSSLTVSNDTDAGFHIAAGYDFNTRFSAEAYYADLGAAEIAFIGDDVGDVDYQVFGLSAIAYLFNSQSGLTAAATGPGMARREGLSIYGRAGIGGVSAASELDYTVNHTAHLALGIGAEYGFSNGFAVRGEYMALDTDQQYASLSVLKRFGKVASALPVAAIAPAVVAKPEPEAPSPAPLMLSTSTVNFEFDQSVLTDDAATLLSEMVTSLKASDDAIMLEGHTDWVAGEIYNFDLSLKRAENVRAFLESKGIERSRMSVEGFGEKRPVATNETDEGRAMNRRVDIRIQK